MSNLIPTGVYEGEIETYGIMKTKQGKPMVAVDFKIEVDGHEDFIRWFGSLNAGMAREITTKTLADLGYKETTLTSLADGCGLDNTRKYFLTISVDEYQGKRRNKIDWINLTKGTSSFVSPKDVASLLTGIDIGADMQLAMQSTQRDTVPKVPATTMTDANDIPF